MSRSGTTSSVVVDASVAVGAFLPGVSGLDTRGLFTTWHRQGYWLTAPVFWLAECVSAIRRTVHRGAISSEEGHEAIGLLYALRVNVVSPTYQHCHAALDWAERLGQVRAYDAFYLALAEELGAELWTADRRLANAAQQAGVSWVRGVS